MLTVGWQDPTNERPSRSSWLAWATRRSVSECSCSSVTGSQVRLAGGVMGWLTASGITGRIVADRKKKNLPSEAVSRCKDSDRAAGEDIATSQTTSATG